MASAAFAKLYCRRTVMSYRYSISGAGTACARGGGANAPPLNVTATTRATSDAARLTADTPFTGILLFRNGVPLSSGCAGILIGFRAEHESFLGGDQKWTTAVAPGQRGCP